MERAKQYFHDLLLIEEEQYEKGPHASPDVMKRRGNINLGHAWVRPRKFIPLLRRALYRPWEARSLL